MERRAVKERHDIHFPQWKIYDISDLLSGPFKDITARLQHIQDELGESSRLVEKYSWGEREWELQYERPETDREMEVRIRRAEANKKAAETRRLKKEEKERELLAKLQAKYGDST